MAMDCIACAVMSTAAWLTPVAVQNRISDRRELSRLLRPCRERPRHCRAAEQRDELAASCMSGKEHCEG
jgi:hypothetical protein